jgi:hypothetical protein
MQQNIDQSTNLLLPSERFVAAPDGVVDEATFVNPTKTDNCSRRLFFLLPGVLIGCITFIPNRMVLIPGLVIGCITFAPNLMLSDAGTKQAKFAATIGLLASGMFVLAGVMGAILKTWKLYPLAILLQLSALLMLSK